MTLARLALRDLGRSPLRTVLTVLAAAIATVAFVFLESVIDLWYSGVVRAASDRLAVRNKTSITQPLPIAYGRRIQSIPGVTAITFAGWFAGRRGEGQRNAFPNFFVDPSTYFEVYDELTAPPAELAAWRADPCGAMIGEDLAQRFGWKPGDRVSLEGTVFPGTWDFTIRGVYHGKEPGADTRAMVFGYRCVNERVPAWRRDKVSFFGVRVADPWRSGAIAAAIDATFANSVAETRTESERAFRLGFVAMSGAILAAIRATSYVILAIMLLVVSNTVAMDVRDRARDMATLRALGFRPRHVIALVMLESAAIGAAAAILGLSVAPIAVRAFGRIAAASIGTLPRAVIHADTAAIGAGAAVLAGVLAGVVPAVRAARRPVIEGLREVA